MQLITTNGYGASANNHYADIDWSKDKHIALFDIKQKSVNFEVRSFNKNFIINTYDVIFNISINKVDFKINKIDKIIKIN